jgi:hypothetical protein
VAENRQLLTTSPVLPGLYASEPASCDTCTNEDRFQVNQQRLKVIEAQEECVEHRQAEMDAKAQLEAVQAMVAELTNRLEDAGQHVDKLAASSKVVRGQQKPKSGTAGPQSTAACSEVCRSRIHLHSPGSMLISDGAFITAMPSFMISWAQ